jgi:DNA-binding MarR family transcriptional regulator
MPTIVGNSLDQMAEEIFSLTVMSWRQRLASKQQQAELSESQFLTLDTLVSAPGPLTVGEIQRTISVLPAQMSRIIRSLEAGGGGFDKPLIRCELNQNDKRKINVAITPDGKRIYSDFRTARLTRTIDTLRHLSDADRQEFVRICRQIREHYRQTEK